MARRASKKKTSSVTVNFKGVESRKLLPEDDYRLKLVEANQTVSSNDNDQIEFVFEVNDGGKLDGQKLWFYCPLTDNSLWKLHGLLSAMGIDVPDDEMDIDLEELVESELEIMGVVQHETYDGQKRSKMVDYYAVEEDEKPSSKKKTKDDGDDEPKGKSRGKAKDDGDDEDDAAAKRRARRKARKDRAAGKDADDGDDEDDNKSSGRRRSRDDDDDDDDKKSSSKKKGGKSKPKLSADEVQGMDEDELGEVIEKYELDVDLDDYKTLRKKAAAVIDALEDADMIEDE